VATLAINPHQAQECESKFDKPIMKFFVKLVLKPVLKPVLNFFSKPKTIR
jgi:hypothetical protein